MQSSVIAKRTFEDRAEKVCPETEESVSEEDRQDWMLDVFRQGQRQEGAESGGDASKLARKATRLITKVLNAISGNALESTKESAITNSEPICYILDDGLDTQALEADDRAIAVHAVG